MPIKCLVIGTQKSAHIDRFISSLELKNSVVDFVLESELMHHDSLDKTQTYSFVLVIGIHKYARLPSEIFKCPIFYLSLAYDIAEIKGEWLSSERLQISKELRKSAGIIVDSRYVQSEIATLDIGAIPFFKLPFGIDQSEDFYEREICSRKITIAALRNWEKVHNQDLVCEVLSNLFARGNQIEVHFAGFGTQKEILKDKYARMFNRGIFIDHGNLKEIEIKKILARSDLYFSGSEIDGSSVTMLEAMFQGCIPVVFDNPANREWIRHGETGFLYDGITSAEDIIQAEITAINYDMAGIKSMRQSAREEVIHRANWDRNFLELIDFLERASNV
jgi:glycosyltransferase involved in cell wall biosynthesis